MGVFACGWLGFVFTRGACSCGCLRALVLARLLGVVGQCGPAAPLAPACLVGAHALVWALLACAGWACAGWASGRPGMGRDNVVPPHAAWRAVPGCCVRGERGAWRVGC